jgi:hypothetical protein
MNRYDYVLTTGWWCDLDMDPNSRWEYFGSDKIREADFHHQWYEAIDRFTKPRKIVIVDSASPVPPPYNRSDDRIEYIRLTENAGHSTTHIGHLCGFTRGYLYGLIFALVNEVDYWVYVEQDALLYGPEIVEHCIDRMKRPYMFGAGKGTPQLTQQSFMIVRKDGFLQYINRLLRIRGSDHHICPENKTVIASSSWLWLLPEFFYPKTGEQKTLPGRFRRKLFGLLHKYLKGYDEIPFGYGRQRPISFEDDFFYFQHASEEELAAYQRKMGLSKR